MTQKNISSSSKEVVFLPLVIFSCSLKTCVDIKFRTFSNNTYKRHLSNVYSCRNKCFYFSRLVDGKISLSISRSWYRPVRFFSAIGRKCPSFSAHPSFLKNGKNVSRFYFDWQINIFSLISIRFIVRIGQKLENTTIWICNDIAYLVLFI